MSLATHPTAFPQEDFSWLLAHVVPPPATKADRLQFIDSGTELVRYGSQFIVPGSAAAEVKTMASAGAMAPAAHHQLGQLDAHLKAGGEAHAFDWSKLVPIITSLILQILQGL